MLEQIEFYTCPDGSINMKELNEPVMTYDQSCREVTEEMLLWIKTLYPSAFKALSDLYSKSQMNRDYFEFQMVHRFIRCNFGEYDGLKLDITKPGTFNFECVKCPLRGECRYEGEICMPEKDTNITEREKEVAKLLCKHFTRQQIADELCISPYTVNRHIANIKARLNLKHTSQILNLFIE